MQEVSLSPCSRFVLLLLGLAGVCVAQSSTPAPAPIISTPCSLYTGKSCEECLKNVSCLWCTTNNTCLDYPVRSIFPPASLCALSHARWGACWINFEVLIITMSVVLGVIILAVGLCCCCCCCRKSSSTRLLEAEEENLIRERERRKHESLQRKKERTLKHNEIRKKYGLLQDMDHPYSNFDNE